LFDGLFEFFICLGYFQLLYRSEWLCQHFVGTFNVAEDQYIVTFNKQWSFLWGKEVLKCTIYCAVQECLQLLTFKF